MQENIDSDRNLPTRRLRCGRERISWLTNINLTHVVPLGQRKRALDAGKKCVRACGRGIWPISKHCTWRQVQVRARKRLYGRRRSRTTRHSPPFPCEVIKLPHIDDTDKTGFSLNRHHAACAFGSPGTGGGRSMTAWTRSVVGSVLWLSGCERDRREERNRTAPSGLRRFSAIGIVRVIYHRYFCAHGRPTTARVSQCKCRSA